MSKIVVSIVLGGMVAGATAAPAEPARRTLYLHSTTPVGNVDEYFTNGGRNEARALMDEHPPAGVTPKVVTIAAARAQTQSARQITAAWWLGDVHGTLSNIEVKLWMQFGAGGGAARVSLFGDNATSAPVSTAIAAGEGPGPVPVTVSFPDHTIAVTAGVRLFIYPERDREVAVYYDAEAMPSAMSFDLSPLPEPSEGGTIDGSRGRVSYNPDGSCRKGDDLCERALALRDRSHVVVAVVDTGINPYHVAFRRTGVDVHPSEYISNYPPEAEAIALSDDPSYTMARLADDEPVWKRVEPKKLYWFPGTNIVGAISILNDEVHAVRPDVRPILDDDGHGTAVTGALAGASFGSDPDVSVVVIEGTIAGSIAWARSQPWIDMISVSYGDPLGLPLEGETPQRFPGTGTEHRWTRPFVLNDGRTACFGTGNGLPFVPAPSSSITPMAGPSWIVSVGAVEPGSGQPYTWSSVPADIVAAGRVLTADAFTTTGEYFAKGTSFSAPAACGAFSSVLRGAREALYDTAEGVRNGDPGVGEPVPGSPLLSDGILSRSELETAVLKTAAPDPFTVEDVEGTRPDPFGLYVPGPLSFAAQGYGLVDDGSARRALDVLLGKDVLPARNDVDAWMVVVDAARDLFFPPEP